MFFVIDKSKIFSYIIAICTVVILFVATAGLNDVSSSNETITTSTNITDANIIETNILKNSMTNNMVNE